MESQYPTGIEVIKDTNGQEKMKSRFYFFMASPPVTGGDLVTIEHAKALIATGVDARFLYLPNKILGTSISQFPPEVPVNYLNSDVILTPADFLITGESQGPLYRDIPTWLDGRDGMPHVIMLNQAVHWMPYAFSCPNHINNMKMTGLICTSKFIEQHMRHGLYINIDNIFKQQALIYPVTEIPKNILEQPSSQQRANSTNKPKCKISYIINIRKRAQEMSFLPFAFLSLYPEYIDIVEFIAIERMNHDKVLEIMRASDIFITSGYMDSHNLPAVEAMAAGCHVLGYTGLTSEVDYFNQENGWWFRAEGEIRRHIHILKEAIDLYYATDSQSMHKRNGIINNAQETVQANFSKQASNTDIVSSYYSIWKTVCSDKDDLVFSCKNKGHFINI